jgi:putative endonuclease
MDEATIYLIHFDNPLGDLANPRGQAQHYLGYTEDLEARLEAHREGNGSAIMAAVSEAGIPWRLVRTWEGGRDLERKLKDQHNTPRFCPLCRLGRQLTLPLRLGVRDAP